MGAVSRSTFLISDYVHVSGGVHLAKTAVVGHDVWIGSGTVLGNILSIILDC